MDWFEKNITAGHLAYVSDLIDEGLFFIDAEARILKTNAAFRKMLGYGEADINGMAIPDIFADKESLAGGSPEMQNNILSFKRYYFDLAAKQPLPLTFLDKEGKKVPLILRAVIFDSHDQENLYGLGIASWGKPAAEHAGHNDASPEAAQLWELEQNYRNILKSSGDAIVITDFNGWIVDGNDAFLNMIGHPVPGEVTGKYLLEFVPMVEGDFPCSSGGTITITKSWQDRHVAYIDTLFETGMVKFESYVVHRDGTHIPIDATMSVLKDQTGDRRGTVAIFKDITERHKAQQAILRAKLFLENVFTTTNDGIFVIDARGHYVMVNEAFCGMTGFARQEIIGMHAPSVLNYEAGGGDPPVTLITLETRDNFSRFETVWKHTDGMLFPVEVCFTILEGPGGSEYNGVVGTARNIAERKRMEEELRRSRDELERKVEQRTESLEEINVALQVLLARRDEDKKSLENSMLHNINELIIPYFEKLKTCRLDARQKTYVDIMEQNFNDLVAPLLKTKRYLSFTPTEIQVANLVRQGKSTKEISDVLTISEKTVAFHRYNIRKKMGLKKNKVSLREHLTHLG